MKCSYKTKIQFIDIYTTDSNNCITEHLDKQDIDL